MCVIPLGPHKKRHFCEIYMIPSLLVHSKANSRYFCFSYTLPQRKNGHGKILRCSLVKVNINSAVWVHGSLLRKNMPVRLRNNKLSAAFRSS